VNEAIKQLAVRTALALGAGAVRVTSAHADEESRRRMQAAFARGDFLCWSYDDEYARRATDPSELSGGARSVVCIAFPYATAAPRPGPLRGRVSNYAWSADYHRRLRALLDSVAHTIDEAVGKRVTTVACDTRPLAERALAARAGLGWIGKHTNLISPGLGSFVFLGEVVTTLELPPDESIAKSCGSCARCVDACPTGALRGDYTIDANLCISDLTQRTDAIPPAMRPLIGDWVWGCDICQLVCPPTRDAFKKRFRLTAMGWRGAAVLRRNAAVALGNALDRSTVGPLVESLCGDPHPMVRGHAAWALGRIGSPDAVAALREQSNVERSQEVRAEISMALQPFGPSP
jgi:epoxyqueuosine reductase